MNVSLKQAEDLLLSGAVVAVPTETVYGLAASLHSLEAIETLFELKKRPKDNPLTVNVGSLEEVTTYTPPLPKEYAELAAAFWPGPLTLILPVLPSVIPSLVNAGGTHCGFRMPNDSLTRKLLKQVGPLVLPSANLSGRPSATTAAHVEEDFGAGLPILDGGACPGGVESTILSLEGDRWHLVRLGLLSPESFTPFLGYTPEKQSVPAEKHSHYTPKAKVHLAENFSRSFSGTILGYRERTYPEKSTVIYLGSLDAVESVLGNLYNALREVDRRALVDVWVDFDLPKQGLWETIRERFSKASG